MKITGVKGMNDILPAQVGRWQLVERLAREVFQLHGYREIRTPAVEPAALFSRGVGETTDIVKKEMYVFEDQGGDKLALRPEGTAGAVRAFVEHGCHVEGLQKWFYIGPMFRRERPQKGRYRQFHQIGAEALGAAEPAVDAEQLAMLWDFFGRLGVGCALKVNSVGDAQCRPAYLETLKAYLQAHQDALCADCKERIERNPLRVLDCKVEGCQPTIQAAPKLLEKLCAPCAEHFAAVRRHLDDLGIPHQVDPRLVRGLDYYTRTAFEISSDALGAQSAVVGGGRYDGLVELLGGPATPAFGFAMGVERLVMMIEAVGKVPADPKPLVFLASADDAGMRLALRVARDLRQRGIAADLDPRGGKIPRQIKQAERVGARFLLVLGDAEAKSGQAKLKELATRAERPVPLAELAAVLASA
jgi:histidyl-tRNA synthetase